MNHTAEELMNYATADVQDLYHQSLSVYYTLKEQGCSIAKDFFKETVMMYRNEIKRRLRNYK